MWGSLINTPIFNNGNNNDDGNDDNYNDKANNNGLILMLWKFFCRIYSNILS